MQGGNLDDLLTFLAVAKQRSFTKGVARLGAAQSEQSIVRRRKTGSTFH